jgi:hypothetical protein
MEFIALRESRAPVVILCSRSALDAFIAVQSSVNPPLDDRSEKTSMLACLSEDDTSGNNYRNLSSRGCRADDSELAANPGGPLAHSR